MRGETIGHNHTGLAAADDTDELAPEGGCRLHELIGEFPELLLALLLDLSLEQWQTFHPVFEADLFEALAPRQVVAARVSEGGTGFVRVEEQLKLWQERLA